MGKAKKSSKGKRLENSTSDRSIEVAKTLAALKANLDLLYKIRVLIYDLRNIAKDKSSEARTLRTTDELYISSPYFTPAEAALIKSTIVEDHITYADLGAMEETDPAPSSMAIEEAIKTRLTNFFEKRRVSGDSRPCGPHDMAPTYEKVFGISRAEIDDERFLSRLRRSGLGDNAR